MGIFSRYNSTQTSMCLLKSYTPYMYELKSQEQALLNWKEKAASTGALDVRHILVSVSGVSQYLLWLTSHPICWEGLALIPIES